MVTEVIYNIVSAIMPFDKLEEQHIQDSLSWIQSGESIFRLKKPDIPNKHLVSYFILLDEAASKILLVDHKNAQLWLPTGGHVEENEDPKETVRRECFEELGINADFWFEVPIFLTKAVTVGLTAGHTDVTLWYVLKTDVKQPFAFDMKEFNSIEWFSFDEIPYEKSDPNMKRFMNKLQNML